LLSGQVIFAAAPGDSTASEQDEKVENPGG
ncbi:uncharacterized protein METZ01_LOCUS266684, partial [marine metagenome]